MDTIKRWKVTCCGSVIYLSSSGLSSGSHMDFHVVQGLMTITQTHLGNVTLIILLLLCPSLSKLCMLLSVCHLETNQSHLEGGSLIWRKASIRLTFRQIWHCLNSWLIREDPPHCGWCYSYADTIGSLRKESELETGSKTVNNILSCFCFSSWLVFHQWWARTWKCKTSPFLVQLLLISVVL